MRTEDDLRHALSDAAQRAAPGSPDARARVGKLVRRQRAWRLGAVAGVVVALAAFGIVSITRSDHRASLRVVSPGPSPSPSAGPGPGPVTQSSPLGGAVADTVPAGFDATSITFVSAKDGYVLGSAPCAAAQPCTVILRTTDTGKTWHRVGAPPASTVSTEAGGPAVSHIRFATTKDGWVFAPDLWVTHDGGAVWSKIRIDGEVLALEAASGTANMVVLSPKSDGFEYQFLRTPVAVEEWTPSSAHIAKGAAPVADAQLVLQGQDGWAVINERTVYGGAELTSGGWVQWQPPCLDAFGPATLMAPTTSHLSAVCAEGVWGGSRPPGVGLYLSDDGGASFTRAAKSVPDPSHVSASPDPSSVVVGSTGKSAAELKATFDRGKTWTSVYRGPASDQIVELGFTTPTQGIAIEQDHDHGTSSFLVSTDGGHSWKLRAFGPTATADRRCATADLRAALTAPAQQGVSQQQTLTFALTNASGSACWMRGYPGISMLTPDGAPVGLSFERTGDAVITAKPPQRIALAPGDVAWVSLNKAVCQVPAKVSATTVRLIAPDERQPLSLALPSADWQWAACDPTEPGHVVHVSPVAPTPRETTSV